MAFVVLFSTMSFTVNMHYCGDTLVETAIFFQAEGCGMEMGKTSASGCSISKKNCCDDKQLAIEGQDELQWGIDKISFKQQVFIASFVYTYINLFKDIENSLSSYLRYSQPLIVRQIFKIDESYLI